MSRTRNKPAPPPAPITSWVIGDTPPTPLAKRPWLLALAVALEALWVAALAVLALR